MLIRSIHFWCKVRMQLFPSLVLFLSVVFSLSSNYKCFLIASLPSGLLRSLFEICRLISTSLAKSPQWLGLDFNVPATERETALKKERIERIDDVEAQSFALQLSNLLTSLQMKCRRMRFHPLDHLSRFCVTAVLLKWLGFLIIWDILWKLFPGRTLFKNWWLD